MQVSHHNSITFRSGLTQQILAMQNKVNIKNIEQTLLNKYGIKANFAANKPIAISCALAISKLKELKPLFKFSNIFPPTINVYNEEKLLTKKDLCNFCLPEDMFVLKSKPAFPKASVFYKSQNSLEEMNAINECDFKQGRRSSDNFLADIFHELMHVIYLKQIAKKYPNDEYQVLQVLQNKRFTKKDNLLIQEQLGHHATIENNQYHEIFAETFTQIICNSLDLEKFSFKHNPINEFKKYPKEFLLILHKVLNIL